MSTGSRDGKGGDEFLELAVHIGRVRAGWRCFLVAGACFIIPATLIVLAFAVLYERYGSTPSGQNPLYGITPVVIAIVAQALWGLLKTAIKGPLTAGVGAVARRALPSEPFSAGNVGQRQGMTYPSWQSD